MDAATFFGQLTRRAMEAGNERSQEYEKNKQAQIRLYENALQTALTSGDVEAAKHATDNLNKLMNIKGKNDSPFGKIVDFAGKIHGAKTQGAGLEAAGNALGGVSSVPQPSGGPQASSAPQQAPTAAKTGILPRIGQGIKAVGRQAGHFAQGFANGQQTLPPIDVAAFPVADPMREAHRAEQTLEYQIEQAQKAEGLSPDSPEGKALGKKIREHALGLDKTMTRHYSPPVSGANIPQNVQQDVFGNPVDRSGKTSYRQDEQNPDEFIPIATPMKVASKIVVDPDSPTKLSYVSYDPITGTVYSVQQGAFQRGAIPRETLTRDQFGNQTISISTPLMPGAASEPPKGTPSETKPKKGLSPISGTKPKAPVAQTLPPIGGLDQNGHIPPTGAVNAQVREAANQLLDGKDIDKLPSKVRIPAAEIARSYGWEQGKFTPKEQIMLREASTFLNQMASSPSLAALDSGFISQLPMIAQGADPAKETLFGKAMDKLSAKHLTTEQAEFMRLYRQTVGTISGLSQLVRSGRATEATINKLIAELPNPYNTKDSADAKSRLLRLKQEISVALEKGTFTSEESTSQPKSQGKWNPVTGRYE